MKHKRIILFTLLLLIGISIFMFFLLLKNKTFFTNVYIGVQSQEIYIPKYSYFKEECCMTAAIFYSLRTEKTLKKEIKNYLNDFEYFDSDTTYGYKKEDLFIQEYKVINNGFYRKIIITY